MPPLAEQVVNDENKSEKEKERLWSSWFDDKYSRLETERTLLAFGTKTKKGKSFRRVGYAILRDFFDGDQWQFNPEGGVQDKVFNFCRGIVGNYTAFMVHEPLDIDVAPSDITDEVEVARAEAKEKALKDILSANKFQTLLEKGVQLGSLLGDTIILGPFYDEKEDKIELEHVKYPENVRIIWEDEQYGEIYGYIYDKFISIEKAYEKWGDLAKERGITFQQFANNPSKDSTVYLKDQRNFTQIQDCWTKDVHMIKVNEQVLLYEKNKTGFVPIEHIANIVHPEIPAGTSDIEDILDAQVEYNEKNADSSEIVKQAAFPYIFGKNLRPSEVQSGQVNIIDLGDEAEIFNDPRVARTNDLNNIINNRRSDILQIAGLNENIFGGAGVRAVTGRALSVLMQTVNSKIKSRQTRWTEALQSIFKNIFIIIEDRVRGGKELVGGFYDTDIIFPGTLMRNITDEINKFNAKLQSQESTMKNIGVPSPKDEKKLMKAELQDQMLMVELSRNPKLQLQLHQMLQQQLAQQIAGNKPVLSEDENLDEQPSAQGGAPQQSAISAEGAVNQSAQRSGTSVAVESEEA